MATGRLALLRRTKGAAITVAGAIDAAAMAVPVAPRKVRRDND
jgi:hypothetical protein